MKARFPHERDPDMSMGYPLRRSVTSLLLLAASGWVMRLSHARGWRAS